MEIHLILDFMVMLGYTMVYNVWGWLIFRLKKFKAISIAAVAESSTEKK